MKLADSLNGIVWRDDSQVVEAVVRKIYASAAKTVVDIEPLEIGR